MTDTLLLLSTEKAVQSERDATTNVIRHFQEIYDRKLFLPEYTSMFEMLTKKYHYCAGSAQIRLNAMKLIKDVPAVEEKIEKGEMSLTVAANVQSFLQAEKKNARPYSRSAKLELVETCTGKSKLEVERELARRNPEIEKRESVHFMSGDRVRVSHSLSINVEEKIQRIKEIWSHVDPNMSREEILDRMTEIVLDKIDPVRKAKRSSVRNTKVKPANVSVASANSLHPDEIDETRSRYINATEAHPIHLANNGQGCEYVDAKTGRRCGSKFQLQRDHIMPFSLGGLNTKENLRLLCAQHNRWRYHSESLIKADHRAYR